MIPAKLWQSMRMFLRLSFAFILLFASVQAEPQHMKLVDSSKNLENVLELAIGSAR